MIPVACHKLAGRGLHKTQKAQADRVMAHPFSPERLMLLHLEFVTCIAVQLGCRPAGRGGGKAGTRRGQGWERDSPRQLAAMKSAGMHSLSLGDCCLQGLKSLQPCIQAWLGRCADAADALAVKPLNQEAAPEGVARCDPEDKLGLTVVFPEDQSLVLWLDKALPQVGVSAGPAD